jgi:hypothetical protein
MSKVTELASTQFTGTDTINVELSEADQTPAAVIVSWPRSYPRPRSKPESFSFDHDHLRPPAVSQASAPEHLRGAATSHVRSSTGADHFNPATRGSALNPS